VHLSRIKALGSRLADHKYVWLCLGPIFIALVVVLIFGATERLIRLTGLALQVLGIGTVIWGISETRALFGHASLRSMAKAGLQRIFSRSHDVTVGVTTNSASTSAGKLSAFTKFDPGPNPSLDSRLDALEKNISAIHDRITETQRELDGERMRAMDALKREAETRQCGDAEIQKKLEATGTGGVHISAIGAAWLFVGVVLSTAAPEIACLLK
jgi:hypothetical protein